MCGVDDWVRRSMAIWPDVVSVTGFGLQNGCIGWDGERDDCGTRSFISTSSVGIRASGEDIFYAKSKEKRLELEDIGVWFIDFVVLRASSALEEDWPPPLDVSCIYTVC